MRKSLALSLVLSLALFVIALAAGQASAADLRFPPPGPGYLPPAYLPLRCRVGPAVTSAAMSGGAWADIDESSAVGGTVSANPAGVAGGGQIACDIQFDQWVSGIRDMLDATNLRAGANFPAGSANGRINWFDTLTAREGYLVQPNVLLYGQGGAAWSSTSVTVFNTAGTQIGSFSNSNQR